MASQGRTVGRQNVRLVKGHGSVLPFQNQEGLSSRFRTSFSWIEFLASHAYDDVDDSVTDVTFDGSNDNVDDDECNNFANDKNEDNNYLLKFSVEAANYRFNCEKNRKKVPAGNFSDFFLVFDFFMRL